MEKIEGDYYGPKIHRPDAYEDDYFSNPEVEEIIDLEQRNDFHIGQCYTKTTCKTLICKQCGSDHFIVGSDDWFTALKCSKCLYEICIHNG